MIRCTRRLSSSPFLAAAALPFMFMDNIRGRKLRRSFDMPIREAINHLVYTVPHSSDSADKAERFFFGSLYTLMCEGKLPVIGARGESAPPRRLSRRECRRHKPIVANVPPSPTSPDGVRFDLPRQES